MSKYPWLLFHPNWNDYHLIVDGKRYEAKHKSYEDWLRFYQNY
ncbi:MAG: hypothetical protein WBM62_17485 [Crocosphaera sp.]|jgi:hypothetical protein